MDIGRTESCEEFCGKEREISDPRTSLLVEFEPELLQGSSRERFKSVCPYMTSFIG